MKTIRDLIAYNDLKERIIEPGFCSLCGACEAACPVNALKIEDDKLQYVNDCSEHVRFCPICYDVCPYTEALLLESLGFVTDAPKKSESLGYYRKIVLAQAADIKIREQSHGGGVVAALLRNSIQKGIIDSAVTSKTDESYPLAPQPHVNVIADDMLSMVDAEHFPSAAGKAFGKAVQEFEKTKIAFVGTPCQVLALRKLESWEHKITHSLKVVIGRMCLWSFSQKRLLEEMEKKYGFKRSDIKRISLDKRYFVHLDNKMVMMPLKDAQKHVLEECSMCMDYTSQLADISVGGAFPLEEWSVIIVRTEIGEKIFDEAVESGAVHVKTLEEAPEVFAHLMEIVHFKEKMALKEIENNKAEGKPVPPATLRLLQPLLSKEISLLSSLSVEQIMTHDVMSVPPDTTLDELLNIMTKHHHMGYPILDKAGNLVGIATFEDIMKIPADERGKKKVSSIKQKKLFTVHPDENVLTAYERMVENNVGRILVVDNQNPRVLLGIVTKTDILQTLRWPMKRR